MALQHTLAKSITLKGIGLHTGEEATVTLHPAPENYGIRFKRTDIADAPEIPADIDNVTDLARGTTIELKGVKIHTIEHCMSALAGCEIDNCRIEVNASEIPLMDGSAMPFVELITAAGITEQQAQREFIVITEPIMAYLNNDVAFGVLPCDDFRVTLLIDYKHPALGAQHSTLLSLNDYAKDFAPARTFCFLSEIEKLRQSGLIKGGRLDNAVVVQDIDLTAEHIDFIRTLFGWTGPITKGENGFVNNTQLRYPNELCRHKVLDLIGDFYLLGKPVKAHIQAARSGHAANIEMAKRIRAWVNLNKDKQKPQIAINYEEIMKILPHRYPFLLVDKVLKIDPGKSIVAIKNVSFNEPFFQGHFPGNPIMPGVLQVEAMAQVGGIMALYGKKLTADNTILFLGTEKVRWRGIVRPGDSLRIECEVLQFRRNTMRFVGKCFVEDKLVCEAELLAMVGA